MRMRMRHYPDPGDELGRRARQLVRIGQPTETGRLLMTMCYAIHEGFIYARRAANGTQPPLETLQLRRGICGDFALLIMGLPDRSGSRPISYQLHFAPL